MSLAGVVETLRLRAEKAERERDDARSIALSATRLEAAQALSRAWCMSIDTGVHDRANAAFRRAIGGADGGEG